MRLWCGTGKEFQLHRANNSKVCAPISRGGGLGAFTSMCPIVLYCRIGWGNINKKGALWKAGCNRLKLRWGLGLLVLKWGAWTTCGVVEAYKRGWEAFSRHTRLEVVMGHISNFGTIYGVEIGSSSKSFSYVWDWVCKGNLNSQSCSILQWFLQLNVSFFQAAKDWEAEAITKFLTLLYKSEKQKVGLRFNHFTKFT